MIGFAQIAGGAPSSTGALTDHLLNSTVGQEQARLAAYYSRGAAKDLDRSLHVGLENNEKFFDLSLAQ